MAKILLIRGALRLLNRPEQRLGHCSFVLDLLDYLGSSVLTVLPLNEVIYPEKCGVTDNAKRAEKLNLILLLLFLQGTCTFYLKMSCWLL